MYESKCYNFDWLLNWLSTNFTEDLNSEFQLSANFISGNFSYAYFQVTPEDIIEAFKILGFKAIIFSAVLISFSALEPHRPVII